MHCNSCHSIIFKDKSYTCTFEIAVDVLGGKWKCLILWHLGTKGTLRFQALRKYIPNITPKMLTQQLRELEADRLVLRKVYAEIPPKVEYSMTEMGESFMPILEQMCKWGEDYYREISFGDKE